MQDNRSDQIYQLNDIKANKRSAIHPGTDRNRKTREVDLTSFCYNDNYKALIEFKPPPRPFVRYPKTYPSKNVIDIHPQLLQFVCNA